MTNILEQTQSAPVTDTCPKRRDRLSKLAELVKSGKYFSATNSKHIAVAITAHIDAVIESKTAVIS